MKKTPPQKDLDSLVEHFKAGRFEKVEKIAISLTKHYPNHAFGWKALAIALKQNGKVSESLNASIKVIEINSKDPEAYFNLGNTYKLLNKSDQAEINYKKAIKLNPNNNTFYNNLALLFHESKKYEEAKINYEKAIKLNPQFFEAYNNLGVTLKDLNKLKESINAYKKAISLNENFADAYNNLGIAFKQQGKFEEAELNYKKAIEINSSYSEAYSNLGILLREKGELEKSKENYIKAIELKSDYAEAHYNLGITYRELGELKNSEDSYNLAIKFNTNYPEAYNNLGVTLRELGRLDESENAYKKAIELKSDYADAYNNLSFTLLLKNNFEEAFKYSEWRFKTNQNTGTKFKTKKPLWNGENNKSVLVWKEQGIGDELLYSSILPELEAKSKKIIVHCDKRLIPLFKRSFPKGIIYESKKENINENDYDYHIPIASLPGFFRNNLKSYLNSSNGYLVSDNIKTSIFKKKLKKNNDIKLIGISWNTKSKIQMSSFRNIKLNDLVTKLNQKNIKFINLQYGNVTDEISNLKKETGIEIDEIPELDKKNEIDDLSSLISACDLIVSIDNFTVHLAGSLGVETKILLPLTMDARWGLNGRKSYLYDSVTLYRQKNLGNWDEILEELKNDICSLNYP